MKVIYPHHKFRHNDYLFLAGGISNCPDWQARAIELLREQDYQRDIINPRDPNYSDTPDAAKRQIEWEFEAFNHASHIMFWFPSETVCPITLFELGKCCQYLDGCWQDCPKIYVGTNREYSRRLDIIKQLTLINNDIKEIQIRSTFLVLINDVVHEHSLN